MRLTNPNMRPWLRLGVAILCGLVIVDVLAALALHWMLHWPLSSIRAWPQALAGVYVAAEFPWYVVQHGVTSAFGLNALEDRLLEPYQGSMPIELLAIGLPVLGVLLSYLALLWMGARDANRDASLPTLPSAVRGLCAGMGFVLFYVAAVLVLVHAAVDGFAVLNFTTLAR